MLTLLTWNISFGSAENLPAYHAVLRAANADVITLNEADDQAVVAGLAAGLDMHHVWARGSGNRHVATLSRYPILRSHCFNEKPLTQAALATTLAVDDGNGKPLTVFNIHLRPDPYWHFELIRYLAANALLHAANSFAPGGHLLMGDFNTFGKGDAVDVATILRFMREQDRKIIACQRQRFLRLSLPRLLRAGYVDCFRVGSAENGYTFTRHGHAVSRMDYILASQPLAPKLHKCHVLQGDLTVSDHFPLMAQFTL